MEEKLVCRSVFFSYKNRITWDMCIFNQPLLWSAVTDNTLPHYLTASNGFTSPPTTYPSYLQYTRCQPTNKMTPHPLAIALQSGFITSLAQNCETNITRPASHFQPRTNTYTNSLGLGLQVSSWNGHS